MALATHVDPEEIVQRLKATHITSPGSTNLLSQSRASHIHPFDSQYASQQDIPKYRIPDEGSPGDTVLQMVRDELDLDGKPNLNLASFVGTFLEPNAYQLMDENMTKNLADADEYPALMDIHQRCVSILAHLWGVQQGERAVGSATTGSSEAIHLGGLAMKRSWQERRRAAGKDTSKPNIIMGANAQVALEKFARYFEVEARILPVSEKSRYRLDPALVKDNIDENTIGVFVIMGSTYTGHYEPVQEISDILDEYQEKTGVDIPIHVDAASGGFIAPFTYAGAGGGAKWNFELPRVKSINTSGHKFGLVPAGLGWIIWRDESCLPEYLVFELHYLGGVEKSYTLNFSRPGAQVVVQYYNLIHLGFQGYRGIMENCLANARLLSESLEATGYYTVVSEIHTRVSDSDDKKKETDKGKGKGKDEENGGDGDKKEQNLNGGTALQGETSADYLAGLPVVAFRLCDTLRKSHPALRQETVSLMLRARGWIIPNYPLPPSVDSVEILRVVVRESMTFDLLEHLLADVVSVTETLMLNDQSNFNLGAAVASGAHRAAGAHVGGGRRPVTKAQHEAHRKHMALLASGKAHKTLKKMQDGIHRAVC